MFRIGIAIAVLILSWSLGGCGNAVSNLQSYKDIQDGYQFLYPNSWIPVEVEDASPGVDTVFRDLIERTENLSVIISDIPENKDLADLGSASDVGYYFLQSIRQRNPKLTIDLISANTRSDETHTYYLLEYAITLPDRQHRHDLASIAIARGKLYTFNLSTTERRWHQVKKRFQAIARSFSLY